MKRIEWERGVSPRGNSLFLWITQALRKPRWIVALLKTHTEESVVRKSLLMVAGLALMAAISGTSAQAEGEELTAHIPFAFRVGTSALPVGDYSLRHVGQSQPVWVIRNDQGKSAVFALGMFQTSNGEAQSAKLLFNRYGDTYFLSQIRCLGHTIELPASRAERTMEREMARNKSKTESVYVLASLR